MTASKYLRWIALITLLTTFASVFAADIARDVRIGDNAPESRNGGFLEIGGGLFVESNPVRGEEDMAGIGVMISGRYRWNGLFIETIQHSSNALSLGYNAWNNENWSVDIIGTSINTEIITDDNKALEGLDKRKSDFLFGGRATGYFGNYVAQLQVVEDASDAHGGVITSLEGGRNWQVRNWNYHALLGIRYHSRKVVDYYLGIRPEEASATLPEYSADAGALFTTEIGVTYPLSEHWLFRGTAQYEYLSDALNQSPIINSNHYSTLSTTFNYVF